MEKIKIETSEGMSFSLDMVLLLMVDVDTDTVGLDYLYTLVVLFVPTDLSCVTFDYLGAYGDVDDALAVKQLLLLLRCVACGTVDEHLESLRQLLAGSLAARRFLVCHVELPDKLLDLLQPPAESVDA